MNRSLSHKEEKTVYIEKKVFAKAKRDESLEHNKDFIVAKL